MFQVNIIIDVTFGRHFLCEREEKQSLTNSQFLSSGIPTSDVPTTEMPVPTTSVEFLIQNNIRNQCHSKNFPGQRFHVEVLDKDIMTPAPLISIDVKSVGNNTHKP
jgi:hypothetical protein